jgi:hypothetical protein
VIQGLIGHTGFVGGNLLRAGGYDRTFNSVNFRDMEGCSFDRLVCAGVSAVKWLANSEPEQDRAQIAALTQVLDKVRAKEFVLISTIDIYPDPAAGGDETTLIAHEANHAYGRHRRELELWAEERFETCRILRLPALFGPGLKKNALYDLIHGNQTHNINPAGLFQWYPIERLVADIEIARARDFRLVNLFGAPLLMAEVISWFFAEALVGEARRPTPEYRVGTVHAEAFGGADGFVLSAKETLRAMEAFVAAERGRA